jgi:hypothetical protein
MRQGQWWSMELQTGVPDPIFLCELALALKMTVSELGDRMSAHELNVVWPAFFNYRQRVAEREEAKH